MLLVTDIGHTDQVPEPPQVPPLLLLRRLLLLLHVLVPRFVLLLVVRFLVLPLLRFLAFRRNGVAVRRLEALVEATGSE